MVDSQETRDLRTLFQELQERILADDISMDELTRILDERMPPRSPPKAREVHHGTQAFIYGLLDRDGKVAYIGRSTNPDKRHKRIVNGRTKSLLLTMWVKIMKRDYEFSPPLVILDTTDTADWYRAHRTFVETYQEKGEAYLNKP